MDEIHVGDVGVELVLTAVQSDGSTAEDVSAATSIQFYLQSPSGSVLLRDGGLDGDGTDGKVKYTTAAGDLTEPGVWSAQAKVTVGGSPFGTGVAQFPVASNIYDQDVSPPSPSDLPVDVADGGTGATSFAAGTLLGGNGAGPVDEVTPGAGLALSSSVLTVNASTVASGTLPVARGGTGSSSFATAGYLRADGTTIAARPLSTAIASVGGGAAVHARALPYPLGGGSDDAPAIQAVLDTMAGDVGEQQGGVAVLAARDYSIQSAVVIPDNVRLVGSFAGGPTSHTGYRDTVLFPGSEFPQTGGTRFVVTGTGFTPVLVQNNSALQGVTFYYPGQNGPSSASPVVYPASVKIRGMNGTVTDCEFVNSYVAIDINNRANTGAGVTQRCTVERCTGQPLYRGITMGVVSDDPTDQGLGSLQIGDIPRFKDVHWNPFWANLGENLFNWQQANGIAFEFGDVDDYIAEGCFAFGYAVGLHLKRFLVNGGYGTWVGGAFDHCSVCVKVTGARTSPYIAHRIVGCGFGSQLAGATQPSVLVEHVSGHAGAVNLTGCSWWLLNGCAVQNDGEGVVNVSDFVVDLADGGTHFRATRSGALINLGPGHVEATGTTVEAVAGATVNVSPGSYNGGFTRAGAGTVRTAWATETNGQSVLASSFDITGASGVFQDTGLEVTLPVAGTYLVTYNVRLSVDTSAGSGWVGVRLYDETAGAAVADSDRLVVLPVESAESERQLSTAFSALVTVAAASTVRLEAKRQDVSSPTWTLSRVASDVNGYTTLGYVKLA